MPRAASEDYYALLGVSEQVSAAELRRIWRHLAKRHHPDHAGPDATAAFQRISAAYAVLCDPVARATYDRGRRTALPRATGTAATPAKPAAARRRAPSVMLARQSGPLMSLLACGIARRVDREVIELVLNAAEARQGGMITISLRVPVRCQKCPAGATVCPHCGGRGFTDELFSAWLAVPPEVPDASVLLPSELLPGMLHPVRFVIRTLAPGKSA